MTGGAKDERGVGSNLEQHAGYELQGVGGVKCLYLDAFGIEESGANLQAIFELDGAKLPRVVLGPHEGCNLLRVGYGGTHADDLNMGGEDFQLADH